MKTKIIMRLFIAFAAAAALLLAATSGNLQWTQFRSDNRHGTGSKGQSFTGSSATDDCAKFDSSGNAVDAGKQCQGIATIFSSTWGGTGADLHAAAAHSTVISNGASPAVYGSSVIPDCPDSSGNHLNYTQSSDSFSCGTTSTGAGTGLFSGTAFTPINQLTSTSSNWQNLSIICEIRGSSLHQYPSSWKLRLLFTAGSPVIGNMVILRTAAQSTTVVDSTTVNIGGVSNPTLTTPGLVDTDTISLALDSTHDYYFVIFFANTGANSTVSVANGGVAGMRGGDTASDQTGVSTIPSFAGTSPPFLVVAGILP